MLQTVILLVFAGLSIPIAFIDIRRHIIPDYLIFSGLVSTMALRLVDNPRSSIYFGAAGAVMAVLFGLIWYFSEGKLGFGDVKLAGYIGIVLGFRLFPFALFFTGLSALLVYIPLLSLGKRRLSERVAFAPFLLSGSWIAILAHSIAPVSRSVL